MFAAAITSVRSSAANCARLGDERLAKAETRLAGQTDFLGGTKLLREAFLPFLSLRRPHDDARRWRGEGRVVRRPASGRPSQKQASCSISSGAIRNLEGKRSPWSMFRTKALTSFRSSNPAGLRAMSSLVSAGKSETSSEAELPAAASLG